MKVKITVDSATEAMELKSQVAEVCTDFSWCFIPGTNSWLGTHDPDWLGNETITLPSAEFDFEDEQWATYFQLKWSR